MIRKECLTKIGGYSEQFDRQDGIIFGSNLFNDMVL